MAGISDTEGPLNPKSAEHERFWSLYRGDLISVESFDVEQLMVSIGDESIRLVAEKSGPSQKLKELSFELALTMKRKIRAEENE